MRKGIWIALAAALALAIAAVPVALQANGSKTELRADAAVATGASDGSTAKPKAGTGEEARAEAGEVRALAKPTPIKGMELVAQTERLALYFNKATTEIAVQDLAADETWYSNPSDRAEDPLAEALNKARLGAQLLFSYYSRTGSDGTMDNFTDSIAKSQFEYEVADGAVTVRYKVGDLSAAFAAPKRFGKQRFEEEILQAIADEKQRATVKQSYRFVKDAGYYEMWGNLTRDLRNDMFDWLTASGYTEDDYNRDNADNGILIAPKASFEASIRYSLDGDALVATVPLQSVKYSDDFPLNKLAVLPYFGAAGTKAEGYMFVPDGSGALIRLNNGKTTTQALELPLYGLDEALDEKNRGVIGENAQLPVFGLAQGHAAMLGIISKGDAIASVVADISGKTHSYNHIGASFTTLSRDIVRLEGNGIESLMSVFPKRMHEGDVEIRYLFLSGEAANYSGMAEAYRRYLNGSREPLSSDPSREAPMFVELIGAVKKRTSFLGIPYRKTIAMTSFGEAETIVRELKEAGVESIKLRYVGWMNGGVHQKLPSSVEPVKALGGKRGLNKLIAFLKEENVDFYPDVSFLSFYDGGIRLGKMPNASQFITQQTAEKYPFNLPIGWRSSANQTAYYITTPTRLASIVTNFADDYGEYGLKGLSVADLGNQVHADYNKRNMVDRQEAGDMIAGEVEKLAGRFPDLLASGGNANALPYIRNAVNVPLTSSRFQLTDESVPFYSMIAHGYADYAGTPGNVSMEGDWSDYKLKLLETGANPSFQWSYESPSGLKNTEYNGYYASLYSDWLQEAAGLYKEVSGFLGEVRSLPMTRHEKLADGVYRTTYGDSRSVTVNYNDATFTADGAAIEPKGYRIGGIAR
ncbi:DUF5696 domain-containing protein [Cohnella herbarum]|uniref:Uncharacterized protein n=1 Tax=Cohnella herbarum TaxID=2728023 RepID=A0A7Z2VQY5_9BACL|nr:DUF5696 domain-containing protein [Cohnella herbarum]QJD87843.1 hypothetical protein HH215_34715 [Cohnella herbarum]